MMNERVLPSDVETFSLAWENHRETTIYLLFRTGLLCENTFELRQMTFYRIPKVLDRMLGGGCPQRVSGGSFENASTRIYLMPCWINKGHYRQF